MYNRCIIMRREVLLSNKTYKNIPVHHHIKNCNDNSVITSVYHSP